MEKTLDNCNPSHPISVISLHGTNDYVVPYKEEGLSSVENSIGFNNNTSKFDEKVLQNQKGWVLAGLYILVVTTTHQL